MILFSIYFYTLSRLFFAGTKTSLFTCVCGVGFDVLLDANKHVCSSTPIPSRPKKRMGRPKKKREPEIMTSESEWSDSEFSGSELSGSESSGSEWE